MGSIKTIIGHTEGAAGLAGLLKASLALRHGQIPPNLHFNSINPAVKPFYDHVLEIPCTILPWPSLGSNCPRRCSVNSFGFGGTNAHAILESFEPRLTSTTRGTSSSNIATPIVLSAASEHSLIRLIQSYRDYVVANPAIHLGALSGMLQERRSMMQLKVAYTSHSAQEVVAEMTADLVASKRGSNIGIRSTSKKRLLGVFTGQGAQWAAMGACLIHESACFAKVIDELEISLQKIGDPPLWSLRQELVASPPDSRVNEAEFSQPLCTAVQIGLIQLLDAAGLAFDAVIGHSSGEIAAAYAAGYISHTDAIKIAYYRGVHSKLASGPTGCPGGMLAVGISFVAATAFCSEPAYNGRISVGTTNGPLSVTLSGDLPSLREARAEFERDGTFSQFVRVDIAYHSTHMSPCAGPYSRSLQACNIQIDDKPKRCLWVSSITGVAMTSEDVHHLKENYWVSNLVKPVLFSVALEKAIKITSHFDLAIEVGPHPVHRGSVPQMHQQLAGLPLPYHGTLARGTNDSEALSRCLGFSWKHIGSVNFQRYRSVCSSNSGRTGQFVVDLPLYPWHHETEHWRESSNSVSFLSRQPVHELLGSRCDDGTASEPRWRNILRVAELPWLRGHRVQGQIVFPGAGYCIMALEAAVAVFNPEAISHVELRDVKILRATVLSEDDWTEIFFHLNRIRSTKFESYADFMILSQNPGRNQAAFKACEGQLFVRHIHNDSGFPSVSGKRATLCSVSTDRFYASLLRIGLQYEAPFRLHTIQRTLKRAVTSISGSDPSLEGSPYILHPAVLDIAFQTALAAFASPGDGQLECPYLPTFLRRLRFNVEGLLRSGFFKNSQNFDSHVIKSIPASRETSATFIADVESFFDVAGHELVFQVESLTATALPLAHSIYDEGIFSKEIWLKDIQYALATITSEEDGLLDSKAFEVCERVAYHYMRALYQDVPQGNVENFPNHLRRLWHYFDLLLGPHACISHPSIRAGWSKDTDADILAMMEPFSARIEIKLARRVGENLGRVVRNEVSMLEVLMKDNLLSRFYTEAVGFDRANKYLAKAVHAISRRYPRSKILEVIIYFDPPL